MSQVTYGVLQRSGSSHDLYRQFSGWHVIRPQKIRRQHQFKESHTFASHGENLRRRSSGCGNSKDAKAPRGGRRPGAYVKD